MMQIIITPNIRVHHGNSLVHVIFFLVKMIKAKFEL